MTTKLPTSFSPRCSTRRQTPRGSSARNATGGSPFRKDQLPEILLYGVPFRAERPHHGEIAALVGQEPHRYVRARLRPGATSTVSSWASVSAA